MEQQQQHQNQPQQPAQPGESKKKASKGKKIWLVIGIVAAVVAIIGLATTYYLQTRKVKPNETATSQIEAANQAFIDNDKDKALEHAKKALAEQPNNYDVVITVASLSNPEEAKQYYARAFEIYKKDSNFDDSKPQIAPAYWTAANLTERAGQKDLAIKYYEQVIKTANLSNEYEKQIAKESELALKRLR